MRKQFNIASADTLRDTMADAYRAACRMWQDAAGQHGLSVVIQTVDLCTTMQKRALFASLADLAEQTDWDGKVLTAEEWKALLSAGLRKSKSVPNLDGDGFVMVGESTRDMSTREMSELLEFVHAFGALRGVVFGEPKAGHSPATASKRVAA